LLGTWQGDAQEGWIKGTSTFLQVLVSIQSLIFVSEPYFNEPGYERSMGTAEGTRESMAYNSTIKLATVTHAMIDHIEKPKIGFEEVIKIHFLLKRDEIISQVDAWAKEVTSSSELLRLANKLKSLLNGLQLSPKIG
jgi:baculoviral IAP repeat-containing protein 6